MKFKVTGYVAIRAINRTLANLKSLLRKCKQQEADLEQRLEEYMRLPFWKRSQVFFPFWFIPVPNVEDPEIRRYTTTFWNGRKYVVITCHGFIEDKIIELESALMVIVPHIQFETTIEEARRYGLVKEDLEEVS